MTDRVRAGNRLQRAGEFWQETLDSLTAHVSVLDEEGKIVAVNVAWRRFAGTENGASDCVGSNYIVVCDASAEPTGKAVGGGLKELLAGERSVFELQYPCHSPFASAGLWCAQLAAREPTG